jgi:hypothetical protein
MNGSTPALSRLGHAVEQVRAQRFALADLRQWLETPDHPSSLGDTVIVLTRCLARATDAHERTLWQLCRVATASGPPSLAPFVRRLHAEHEDFLGLLGLAVRITGDFLGLEDAPVATRDLLASFGMWVNWQRTVLRSEREELLPALLALDPTMAPEAPPTVIGVARQDTLSTGGVVTDARVFCPGEGRSVALEWCATCPAARHVDEGEVRCTPGGRPRKTRDATVRSGEVSFAGEALSRRHLSVLPSVPAGRVAAAIRGLSAPAVAVVDEQRHFVRLVSADTVVSSSASTPVEDLRGGGARVAESASLADAIAQMIRTHGRFVALTDRDEKVVGVLTDLDVLRWVARDRSKEGRH